MVQEQASHGEKRLAERVSIIVQGLVRCGGRKAARCILKERRGAHLQHQKDQICLGRKGKCRSDSTGINLKVRGVAFIAY